MYLVPLDSRDTLGSGLFGLLLKQAFKKSSAERICCFEATQLRNLLFYLVLVCELVYVERKHIVRRRMLIGVATLIRDRPASLVFKKHSLSFAEQ